MGIRATIINKAEVEVMMEITMPLGDWMKLKDQLNNAMYPGHDIWKEIAQLIRSVEKHFYNEPDCH